MVPALLGIIFLIAGLLELSSKVIGTTKTATLTIKRKYLNTPPPYPTRVIAMSFGFKKYFRNTNPDTKYILHPQDWLLKRLRVTKEVFLLLQLGDTAEISYNIFNGAVREVSFSQKPEFEQLTSDKVLQYHLENRFLNYIRLYLIGLAFFVLLLLLLSLSIIVT